MVSTIIIVYCYHFQLYHGSQVLCADSGFVWRGGPEVYSGGRETSVENVSFEKVGQFEESGEKTGNHKGLPGNTHMSLCI